MDYKALCNKFPNLFSSQLEKVSGVQIKLEMNKSVRPIAFHMRDIVENELKKQVDEGIPKRLDEKSGPTEWVSQLQLKIRLTADCRAVNKAILRTSFTSKTMEDEIVALNGSRVFSKLYITKP